MTTFPYRTRVAVVVDSHEHGNLEISRDVIACSTNKQTKATGKWQLQVVPRRNYLDLIHPDDVVNIYIDPGDGESGFVRTMFGFVDRVERTEKVGDNGELQTTFSILGSDFQKAIDKTSLYFNNYMRQILSERLARSDQGRVVATQRNDAEGFALRNAGITSSGTPADLVENFLMILLGFGQQWVLPESYARKRGQIELNRERRVQRARARIPAVVLNALTLLGLNKEFIERQVDGVFKKVREIAAAEPTEEEKLSAAFKERRDAAVSLRTESSLLAYRSVIETTASDFPVGIVDLLSFDFIEALAIDGWQANAAVWQAGSQTLAQFLYGNTNGIINELMFDLRPESLDGGLQAGDYSKEEDELGVNSKGTGQLSPSAKAVKYVPSVVLREYPYAVADGIDLSGIFTIQTGESTSERVAPGFIPFGPIFSMPLGGSKRFGRVTYQYNEAIRPTELEFFDEASPKKHLDVVSIRNEDVKEANIGRSDEDVINALQMGTRNSGSMDEQQRAVLSNFSPVVNQISIARHGLRVWEGQTQYANYATDKRVKGAPDSAQVRRNLIRWQLLMDHWWQHNVEYLTGTITLRGMPHVRAGYRLDWVERHESYYVEAVQHQWNYPGVMTTTVQVSRGQRNDPYLAYIPPVFINDSGNHVSQPSGDRGKSGRLGRFFSVLDTKATLQSTEGEGPFEATESNEVDRDVHSLDINAVSAGLRRRGMPLIDRLNPPTLVPGKLA